MNIGGQHALRQRVSKGGLYVKPTAVNNHGIESESTAAPRVEMREGGRSAGGFSSQCVVRGGGQTERMKSHALLPCARAVRGGHRTPEIHDPQTKTGRFDTAPQKYI